MHSKGKADLKCLANSTFVGKERGTNWRGEGFANPVGTCKPLARQPNHTIGNGLLRSRPRCWARGTFQEPGVAWQLGHHPACHRLEDHPSKRFPLF
jgi:hypothetical protein